MIQIFSGDDRAKTAAAIKRILGDHYEVIEGANVEETDMPNIFLGSSLFSTDRKILIKDLGESKAAWAVLPQYLKTGHNIIIWEKKLDKRTSTYKALKKAKVKMTEFKLPPEIDSRKTFDVFDIALSDGVKAVALLKKLVPSQDPYRYMGLLTTQAIRQFDRSPTTRNRAILKELSKLDIQLKTTKFSSEPWSLIEAFLLRLQEIK